MKISKIFITHFHGDHILGLPGLIQSMNFRGRDKKLTIYGPKGLNVLKESIFSLGYCKIEFPIEFIEIGSEIVEKTEDYIIKSQEVNHLVPSLAYSIEELKKPRFLRQKAIELGKIIKPEQVLGPPRKGRKITYSGDTTPCEEMVELAKDSTLLIHESTYVKEDSDKAEENYHSTSSDAASIAKKSNSKKLILTHISTRYQNTDQLLNEALEIFENTEIAKDLKTIKCD